MSLDVDAEKEIPSCELIATKCIGSGVTSEVYQGHWNRIGRVVAIKMITDRCAFRTDEQLAFAREMKVLTQVQHENLVTFYGVCINSPPLRIVTEFCEGGACFELLHNSDDVDLIWPQQIKMCKDVAAAMYYLHTFDPMIIHRDLKSLNLLLDRPVYGPTDVPSVKVCDFGVAKLQREGEWGQMTAQAGTKHWMAPEMWRGTRYDEKVDVFSYAMVIYEIVCREVPFEEEEPADVGKYTLAGVRPDMDAVPPDTPPDLIHVILGCRSAGPKNPEIDPVFLLLDPPGVIFVVKHLGKAALKVQAGSRQCPSVDQHRRLDPMIPMIPMPIRESVKLEKSGTVTPCMLMACGVHRHIFNYVLRPLAALALGDPSMILGWKRWVLGAGSPEERDLCRQVANTGAVVRATLLEESLVSRGPNDFGAKDLLGEAFRVKAVKMRQDVQMLQCVETKATEQRELEGDRTIKVEPEIEGSPWHRSKFARRQRYHSGLPLLPATWAMAAFCYQKTFIEEVVERVAEVRARKTLTVPKDATSLDFMHDQKRLALQVSKLQERSQLPSLPSNEIGAPRVQEIPSPGSHGHPNICRRPCILLVKGKCQKGSACGFCHLEHELRIPSFDKQQRDYLKLLPRAIFLQMILPYVRKTVEASELPGACQVLQLLESEIVVRAFAGFPKARRFPRRIRHVLGRMSLANLVSVICSTLTGRFPKVLATELKDLRDTAQTLES
ncbi:unnamed protein product [Cladocopium goreaui]|uniref:Protein kinase domain-containing protein n=1 Tax=Cladocopium goreaui TaxID=2562237 RepID=A0A9P1C251_9DINO|nr:unnamed protein product [Cladocopium goreaui]